MLVTAAELLRDSVEKRYALGAFDTTSYPLTEAILRAAEESQTPLIMMMPPFAYGRSYDDAYTRHMVQRCREIKTPVALHLDHAAKFEQIQHAIESGFSSVMIDASALPFEQNVEMTRKVVRFAHERGVSVEAEIGHVGGGEGTLKPAEADSTGYTNPDDAVRFVNETGVDLLAVAFGTVHGSFLGTPKLDLPRLRTIRQRLPKVPLVMHGGSGLSDDDFRAAVASGVNKINVFTEISTLYTCEVCKALGASSGKLHLHNAVTPAEDAVVNTIHHLMQVFGTPHMRQFPPLQPMGAPIGRKAVDRPDMRKYRDEHPLKEPTVAFNADIPITVDEFDLLSAGLMPNGVADKWRMYVEDDTLYIHRSWTDQCMYAIRVQHDGFGYRLGNTRMVYVYGRQDHEDDRYLIRTLVAEAIARNSKKK